ncbi:MAG TPA: helix-turn-helix transcriptional regulator [Thermoanaerobaculia bacterium]|nr:helix-turn-helix transcriptional regulator [Thermoanaerobaculia bacterium]
MIGTRIRELRTARRLSLSDVAQEASISTATLSRIETGKQNIDVGLMTVLARVLHISPHDLLDAEGEPDDFLADKIATLKPDDRARFWRDLTGSRKRNGMSSRRMEDLGVEVEELLAQIDFLRGEVDRIRQGLRGRNAPRRAAR